MIAPAKHDGGGQAGEPADQRVGDGSAVAAADAGAPGRTQAEPGDRGEDDAEDDAGPRPARGSGSPRGR